MFVGEVHESRRLFDTKSEYEALISRSTPFPAVSPGRRRTDRLSIWQTFAYALPALALAAQYLPTHIHVFKFYTDVLLVPAGSLAIGTAIARAADCIIDPVIGWISDHTTSSYGRRKPYIALSLPINAMCYYLLFTPSQVISPRAAASWFTFFFFIYLAVPLSLPYSSLGPELTSDNKTRLKMYVMVEILDKIGIIFASLLPTFLLKVYNDNIRAAFSQTAFIICIVTLVSFAVLLVFVEEPQRRMSDPREVKSSQFVPGIRRAMRNMPYRQLIYAASIGTVSHSITNVIFNYYISCVIQVPDPEKFVGYALCFFFIPSAVSLPFWHALAHVLDTRRAWLFGWVLHIPICFGMFFLKKGDQSLFFVLTALMGASYGSLYLCKAMVSDSIDYDELRTGSRSEGQLIAWITLIPKLAVIPASSLPLVVLQYTGYIPNVQHQNSDVTISLRVMMSIVPAFLSSLAFIFAYRYPITGEVQERIQRMIASDRSRHDDGSVAIDPITGNPFVKQHAFDMDMDHFSIEELNVLTLEGGWKYVHRRILLSLLLWTIVMICSIVLAIFNITVLTTVLSTASASVCLLLMAYHAFRIRALYEFDEQAHLSLQSDINHLRRIRSQSFLS